MMEFNLEQLLRKNIRSLVAYSSARDEFKGKSGIFLDANENSMGSALTGAQDYNRYPDPMQLELKKKLSLVKGVPPGNIFLGNGSDEAIDILFRAFCEPGKDNVILVPPTYGMYEVSANINDVEVRKVRLTENFQLDIDKIAQARDKQTKLIFICSPNNPTGNSVDPEAIELLLNNFEGVVVVDEAYINFSKQNSFISRLIAYPNLVVLQTFSKAWGMAGLRIGMAFAGKPIIAVFNKIKPPYNINIVSQQLALEALANIERVNNSIKQIVAEREKLSLEICKLPFVLNVFPSDANFVLVKTSAAKKIYDYLVENGIVVRDRSKVELCEGCLRITVGTVDENLKLLNILKKFNS